MSEQPYGAVEVCEALIAINDELKSLAKRIDLLAQLSDDLNQRLLTLEEPDKDGRR